MARQKGIVKLAGPIGDLSFYPSVFGDIVRRKGGASKEKIKRSPAFKRLREHQKEFADCSSSGKLMRQALVSFTKQAADFTLVGRMMKVLNLVKDQDKVSARGKRRLKNGLRTKEGKMLFKNFDFNSKAVLSEILRCPVAVNGSIVEIKGMETKKHLAFPKGANAVCIRAISGLIDFEEKRHSVKTDEIILKRGDAKSDIVLKPGRFNSKGFTFYLLQIVFIQYVNEIGYDLKEGRALRVLEVV